MLKPLNTDEVETFDQETWEDLNDDYFGEDEFYVEGTMNSEALEIYNSLNDESAKINAKIYKEIRNGKPYIGIFCGTGGWLGAYLENCDADIAPYSD